MVRSKRLKLANEHVKKLSYNVKVRDTIAIQARQEGNIEVEVSSWRNIQNSTRVLEPVRSVFPTISVDLVRILNPHDKPIQLFKCTTLGLLRKVDRIVGWQETAQLVDSEEMPDLVHPESDVKSDHEDDD